MCWWKRETIRILKNMLILMTGLLYQIPNILCSLEKALGSMILLIDLNADWSRLITNTFCAMKSLVIQGYPNDAATCWLSDYVRFLFETFTDTTIWNLFSIVRETLILRAFQNLPILDQLSTLLGPRLLVVSLIFKAPDFLIITIAILKNLEIPVSYHIVDSIVIWFSTQNYHIICLLTWG